jgi:hypothetical protein
VKPGRFITAAKVGIASLAVAPALETAIACARCWQAQKVCPGVRVRDEALALANGAPSRLRLSEG